MCGEPVGLHEGNVRRQMTIVISDESHINRALKSMVPNVAAALRVQALVHMQGEALAQPRRRADERAKANKP